MNVNPFNINPVPGESSPSNNQQDVKSRPLSEYGIDPRTEEGRQALIEIAKIEAQQKDSISSYIQNYGIDAQTEEGMKSLIDFFRN